MRFSLSAAKISTLALCWADLCFATNVSLSSSSTGPSTNSISSSKWTTALYYNTTTTTSTTPKASKTTLSTISKAQSATTTSHKKITTSPAHHNSSTTSIKSSHKPPETSSLSTESLAQSIVSEIVQPSYVPQHPWGPKFIPSGNNGLPQSATNGKSPLGTFHAPQYPPWIGHGNGSPKPWGNRGAGNTNPYTQAPNTGVTRFYNFVIDRQIIAPDGVERSVILVNDQFPGPTIEANWGDTIQVTVTNKLTDEGTAIHWHGLLQKGTPYMDGIPGITQCPIAPGQTFTYSFQADLYGSSWWHAHYSAQYAGGLFGAMIIHGPDNTNYDIDMGPILLTDYYHDQYFDIVEEVMGTDLNKTAPFSVNNLINGKGVYNCSLVPDSTQCTPNAGLSHFTFQSGKEHRLRLINAGAEGIQKFSIDGHTMQVMAYDFVPIVPYETEIVTLSVGQRADVIVKAKLASDSAVWMRSTISSCSLSSQPNGLAMIYYEGADTSKAPVSTAWTDTTNPCANDDLSTSVPYFALTPAPDPSTTTSIDIDFGVNATGHLLWTMNNSTFRVNYNEPILDLANAGNTSYPDCPEWNVYDFGSNSSIRLVIENLTPVAHPMHLHGHNMYVLAEGAGSWNGDIINAQNPTRRDVQLVRPNGYIVIQLDADNPGVWPFHCHIAWHVSGGLYVNIMERPDDIAKMNIPTSVKGLCSSWDSYSSGNVVDEIDSGL